MSEGVARCAARAAIGGSIASRKSRIVRTSRDAGSRSPSRLAPRPRPSVSLTTVPRPCSRVTSPLRVSSWIASRTDVRDTPSNTASSRSLGSRVPGDTWPSAIMPSSNDESVSGTRERWTARRDQSTSCRTDPDREVAFANRSFGAPMRLAVLPIDWTDGQTSRLASLAPDSSDLNPRLAGCAPADSPWTRRPSGGSQLPDRGAEPRCLRLRKPSVLWQFQPIASVAQRSRRLPNGGQPAGMRPGAPDEGPAVDRGRTDDRAHDAARYRDMVDGRQDGQAL